MHVLINTTTILFRNFIFLNRTCSYRRINEENKMITWSPLGYDQQWGCRCMTFLFHPVKGDNNFFTTRIHSLNLTVSENQLWFLEGFFQSFSVLSELQKILYRLFLLDLVLICIYFIYIEYKSVRNWKRI